MTTQLQIEINVIIAVLAIFVSVATFIRVGKWRAKDDTTSHAATMATILEKVDNIEASVEGIPSLRDTVIRNEQTLKAHEHRITVLEKKDGESRPPAAPRIV